MNRDVKLALIATPLIAVPLFLAFAFLVNPHGDTGFFAVIGLLGVLAYAFVASELVPVLGTPAVGIAVIAQLLWTSLLIFSAIKAYRALRYLLAEPTE